MAQMVTIEGSMTPSSDLPRGQRRDVVYTDRIARLVKKGFVVIVGDPREIPDASEHIAEGTGTPNVGIEVPADGTFHEISGDGSGKTLPPVEQPMESTTPLTSGAHSAEAALHDPKALAPESGIGG
jgi:hypothetical protein